MKRIILLALTLLTAIPGIHKLLGEQPPQWFHNLFDNSLIGTIPFGVQASFTIIMLLELTTGLVFTVSLLGEFRQTSWRNKRIRCGFIMTQLLFLILFFGSFLIENYDNGFKDFIYLVSIAFVQHFFFVNKKESIP